MQDRVQHSRQMSIEDFLAFTDTRPDGEKWELIEGKPVMSPSPTDFHQIIAGNLVTLLNIVRRGKKTKWRPLIGTGTRVPVSPRSLPQPDVMVKAEPATGSPVSDEALVLFEILSKSNSKRDQSWRKKVYASIPNCQHYVTVEQQRARIVRYDRSSGWEGVAFDDLAGKLELPALGARLALADIYDGTPIAENDGDEA